MKDEWTKTHKPLYMISVAASLAGMHPQTLRVYEQKGLINPDRSDGNTRLYSQADIERLDLIAELTKEGINLAGVIRILDLMEHEEELDNQIEALTKEVHHLKNIVRELQTQKKISALVPYEEQDVRDLFYSLVEKKLGG